MIGKLQTLVDAGRVPTALVIDGGTFESRLYCAKELAAALLKEDKKVMADIHPDVITVLPEEKKKTLSPEEQLNDPARFALVEINNVHDE